jgi:hypothetical protein
MNTTINTLREYGILASTGEVNIIQINSISGAVSGPLARTLWEMSDCNPTVLPRLHGILNELFRQGRESEIMGLLHLLYSIMCVKIPDTVLAISKHPAAQNCFLAEFLLDLEDIMEEFGTA